MFSSHPFSQGSLNTLNFVVFECRGVEFFKNTNGWINNNFFENCVTVTSAVRDPVGTSNF